MIKVDLAFITWHLPRIEYLFAKLEGAILFFKIDLSEAYQQILIIDNKARISTHKDYFLSGVYLMALLMRHVFVWNSMPLRQHFDHRQCIA